jgi:hypothetical protein
MEEYILPLVKGDTDVELMSTDQLLAEMLQEGDDNDFVVVQIPVTSLVAPLLPVTAIDHPPGRAVRQASFAPKSSWREAGPGQLYYLADNGLQVSLGTPEKPLNLNEARQEIKKLGESTVLTDRLLFWLWNLRRRPRPEDGKVFVGKNGSVPVALAEILQMLGRDKHTKLEHPGQRYTDGFRPEQKQRVVQDITILSAFHVQGAFTAVAESTPTAYEVKGPYLRSSQVMRKGILVGFFVSPGDWINTIDLPDIPSLIRIDEQIFKFDPQNDQHEIRIALYLAERFRDQATQGTLGQPLRVPIENQPGRFRLPTMEDLLNGSMIKIDRNNLTIRFVPRIENALQVLKERDIVGRAEPVTPVNKQQAHWGKMWLNTPFIIQAPVSLIEEYRALHASLRAIPKRAASRGKARAKLHP